MQGEGWCGVSVSGDLGVTGSVIGVLAGVVMGSVGIALWTGDRRDHWLFTTKAGRDTKVSVPHRTAHHSVPEEFVA